jgi:GT2 family glycosyltransferase
MMPQILNEDGSIQNLPKLLPSPFSILKRKIKKPTRMYQKFINEYELREVSKDLIYNAPVLSGCFTLLNLDAIKKVGMYDDAFFMYFEDWDLSRRIHQQYKTIYFPKVSVVHEYESGANKNPKLFKIFVNSAITYFNKWGWFFDSERKKVNKEALSQFK